MKEQDRPVVVLVERKDSDEDVMREGARPDRGGGGAGSCWSTSRRSNRTPRRGTRGWQRPPEPWQRMLGLEATVSYDLRLMAQDWVGPATPVDVEVRFGDAVSELAAVAEAPRPASWRAPSRAAGSSGGIGTRGSGGP